ncbi:hypothetical protein I6N96_16615 [Enterococcus sp. BWM-S5]|uniref:Uncharacterized protein n=1 Tax=Enterococcus larvae TaxID=2794352 RepID=A0ABS4CMU9_9ENTE|nr:hypothetical protein [Enterococcus larvae]MBP1047916.1 hypothetical protein [Enterococcus larvae]
MKIKKGVIFSLVGLLAVAVVSIGAYLYYVKPNQIKSEAIAYAKKNHNQTVVVKKLEYAKISEKNWTALVAIKEFPDVEYTISTKNGKRLRDTFGYDDLEELIAQIGDKSFNKKYRKLIQTELSDDSLVISDISVPLESEPADGVEFLQDYLSFTQKVAESTKDLEFEATISNGVKAHTLTNISETAITETIDSLYSIAPYLVKKDSLKISDTLKKALKDQGYTDVQLNYTKSPGTNKYFASLAMVYDNLRNDNIDNKDGFDPNDLLVEKDGKKYYEFEKQLDPEYTTDQGLALTKELIKDELSVYEVTISFTSGSYGSQEEYAVYSPITITEPLSVTEPGGIYGGMLSADTINAYGLDSGSYYQEELNNVALPGPFEWVNDEVGLPIVLSDYTKSNFGVVLSYDGALDDLAKEIPELNKNLEEGMSGLYALIMIKGSPVSYYFQTTTSQSNYQLYKIDQAVVENLVAAGSVAKEDSYGF